MNDDLYARRRTSGTALMVIAAVILVLGMFLWIHSTSRASDQRRDRQLLAAMEGRDASNIHVEPNRAPALAAWAVGAVGLLAGIALYASAPPHTDDQAPIAAPKDATDGWS
jgi:peptidoglycan/LPS O-acetylase OafA/YrhL